MPASCLSTLSTPSPRACHPALTRPPGSLFLATLQQAQQTLSVLFAQPRPAEPPGALKARRRPSCNSNHDALSSSSAVLHWRHVEEPVPPPHPRVLVTVTARSYQCQSYREVTQRRPVPPFPRLSHAPLPHISTPTHLNTILRCFLSFRTVVTSRNIIVFKIFFPGRNIAFRVTDAPVGLAELAEVQFFRRSRNTWFFGNRIKINCQPE